MTTATPRATGTNETAGARRIAAAFARARADGRVALIPYVVAGYPDAETSLRVALAAADAGADLLEVGLPYSDPLADGATLQRASGVALKAGATLEDSLRAHRADRRGPARAAAGPDGLRQPGHRRRRREAVARRLAGAGAAGLIVADLTPDEGGAVRGRRPRRRPRGRLPRRPDDVAGAAGAIAARSGGFLYCVSLVGVTGARTSLPRSVGRLVRDVKAASPRPGRGRLRGQPPGPRPRHRRGGRGWRHRRVGAGRRARPGRSGRRRPRPARRGAARGDRLG